MNANVLNNLLFVISSFFYNLYKDTILLVEKYQIKFFSVVSIIIISIFTYYLFQTNPYNIMNYLQSTTVLFYLCFTITLLVAISLKTNTFTNIFNFFKMIGYIIFTFMIFSLIYFISRKVLYYGATESSILTVFIIMSIMAIFHRLVLKQTNSSSHSSSSNKSYNFILEVIFYIPCLLLDIIDYIKKDFSNTTGSTYILALITTLIVLLYYILPYFYSIFKDKTGITLQKKKKEMNTELIFVSQDELKKKIINSRPLLKRQILKFNAKIENHIKVHGKYFDEKKRLFDVGEVYGSRKYISDYGKFDILKNHPDCVNTDVICDTSDNILKCNNINIKDKYNVIQTCNINQSVFDYLFTAPKDVVQLYKSKEDDEKKTLTEICEIDAPGTQISVNCINYNDVSNIVAEKKAEYNNKSYYACNDLDLSYDDKEKYKIINAYNDNGTKISVECDSNIESFSNIKETFESEKSKNFVFNADYLKFINIDHSNPKPESEGSTEIQPNRNVIKSSKLQHKIDTILNEEDLLSEYSTEEKQILEAYIKDEDSNLRTALSQFSDEPEKAKQFIVSYFSSNENYMTLIRYINKYNGETNRFLNQELSALVRRININNNIHTYNYHYGLSFWVYFDTSILNNSQSYKKGLIMNYANQPKLYFDYLSNELVIEMYKTDKLETIYKSKDIIFQRWNNFVVNFNYGVLDVFVNNNLVFTTNDITPYIDDKHNNIIFGSDEEPLHNCGLCSVVFYDKPLTLSKIKNIYKKNNNPCQ